MSPRQSYIRKYMAKASITDTSLRDILDAKDDDSDSMDSYLTSDGSDQSSMPEWDFDSNFSDIDPDTGANVRDLEDDPMESRMFPSLAAQRSQTPGLFNESLDKGPQVAWKVFALPLRRQDIRDFLKRHCQERYRSKCPPPVDHHTFALVFREYFPPQISRVAYIRIPSGDGTSTPEIKLFALVLGSNATMEDLEKTENEELALKAREILNVSTPFGWYFVVSGEFATRKYGSSW
ncbi:hypothetical protein CC1G_11889 [Coprinopsis cinerea okayama7|uniref:Uncharacterized protein n=1 Tax=Coprinopsis cinerea (strain Okayama-7 / 130 / ATCC MYA-4618 / FGSC 9003) TaxID=240176 RepID=A8P3J9_COPC7|nr:hypothetical protein CC1G_11889 [Coprinopsis cinerea okayama7\|eukprot:XP_001838560.2 hypothetical protein CC1G_11889 [Coprinopsis cinerea okayama7\